MAATRRLSKEYESLVRDAPPGIKASPLSDDLFHWNATLEGPPDTPYEGGVFQLKMDFPNEYPFRPPKVTFLTQIYHPNINLQGGICLDILRDKWAASLSIRTILLSISSLVAGPNPDDPLMPEIANLYKSNRERFNMLAREWTATYASE